MSLFGGLFNKEIKQNSTTTNVDNTRTNTLTDSLNSVINNNLSQVKSSSVVNNSAFDATDSFNTVMSYELQNIGVGPQSIPTLDFTGLRSIFTNPADLVSSLNANKIDADPNKNKYDFSFNETSAGGNEFLKGVQGLVNDSWKGLTDVSTVQQNSASGSTLIKPILIAAVVIVGLIVILKLRR